VRIRFSDCVLDTAVRELRLGGQVKPLSPKAFLLLEALAERRPQAIAHEELRRVLWPDAVAGGTTLARLVTEVRAALGDRARSARFIRTLHRFGYAFCAAAVDEPVSAPPAAMAYALQWGRRHVPLEAGENIIGRVPGAVVSPASSKVSRRHARILVVDDGATLEDLGSKNGTCVGERCIDGPVPLHDGDRILVGPVLLVFNAVTRNASTSTLRRATRRTCR
jgi:DNA-binding winged helix-turn-helix (wHTH) protein